MVKQCLNCGKPISDDRTFCDRKCWREYRKKQGIVEEKEIPKSLDLNIELIQKALETKTEIKLVPRRSHTIKGIPVRFDNDTYRIYVDTGRFIESVLLKEIGCFIFPKELCDVTEDEESFMDYVKRQEKEKEGKK